MPAILDIQPLGFQWQTPDPFLFCAWHEDFYPRGNEALGPDAPLDGRKLGSDFEPRDGWRMYHGQKVPGFPGHPHRGFETVTIVRRGTVDHADSLGAAGRYAGGDVQWLTAGRGVQHSEMFPLLERDRDNPLELLQLWLNLPAANKLSDPHFTMFWREEMPLLHQRDEHGRDIEVEVVAGELYGVRALAPPPASWAADPANKVAIWLICLAPGAQWTVPAATPGVNRQLYFFQGESLRADGRDIAARHGLRLRPDAALALVNGDAPASLLLLQGRPIGEPVAQYGPFVMNTRQELQQAFEDYQRDQFGGWPWPGYDHVHGRRGRFARYPDGREEER